MPLCGNQVPSLRWAVKFSLGALDIQEQFHKWWELGLDIQSSACQTGLGVDWSWWWWMESWQIRWRDGCQWCFGQRWATSVDNWYPRLILTWICFFVWKGYFIQHRQKSYWILAQGGNGLDLAAVEIIKVCITKAFSWQSDFFHGSMLQFSDYVNIHVFFSRQQIIFPGGSVQLYHFCRLS